VGSHWVVMSEEPTEPKFSTAFWFISAIIVFVALLIFTLGTANW